MTTVKLEYDIKDDVEILLLERTGRIESIWITETGIKYEVRYFDNAELKIVYFYGDELEAKK